MAPNFADHLSHVQSILNAAVAAADPAEAVRSNLHLDGELFQIGNRFNLKISGGAYLISVGKAALSMGQAAADLLGDRLTEGIVVTKHNQLKNSSTIFSEKLKKISLYGAGHPLSDESSLAATAAIVELLSETTSQDLVLCLFSGGTSSLLSQPVISLENWQLLVKKLLASGCTINELNSVRKRLDRIKGGGLAIAAMPARCFSLILSDVIGNPLDMIGSGPTVPNPDPDDLAKEVLLRYGLEQQLPPATWQSILAALKESSALKAKPFQNVENIVVGDVRQAAGAAVSEAERLGFNSSMLTAHLEGEARHAGAFAAALAKDAPGSTAIVLGGETTVTLKGVGTGGRNQELVLAAAIALDGWPDRVVASFATDGDDGPTDAAGAIVTGETVSQAHFAGIDPVLYLDNNDSYTFFGEVGGHINTGPSGTNVNDLILILNYEP